MDRSHLYLPLVDSSGATHTYAEVTLLNPETGVPIEEPVYLEPHNGAPQTWPILFTPAVINLWIDRPMRVVVQAALPGGASYTRAGVDIAPAPSATIRSREPLRIGSAQNLDGSAMLALSPDGSAAWQVLDALRFHRHEGAAPGSTVLAPGSPGDIYGEQTWLGAGVSGGQGTGSSALGAGGVVTGAHATTVGRGSATATGTAVGVATSEEGSFAAGAQAVAAGVDQVVLGAQASAPATRSGAVALGGPVAAGEDIRVGHLRVGADGTVSIGRGALPAGSVPDGPHVALLETTVVGPYLRVLGDALLGGGASSVGFYGAAGGTRPVISTAGLATSAPGRAALLSLMAALHKLGLIRWSEAP
ncbi:hypothetical protein [Streptomyces albidoflavus]|uniref:hypothetical protein n=1 Tax=Streptomyces albidoflavus TaxID=1886 RepID=UPI0033D5C02D